MQDDVAFGQDTGKGADGRSDANIRFRDLVGLLKALGFDERIKGDHHIFTRDGVAEIINLQSKAPCPSPIR